MKEGESEMVTEKDLLEVKVPVREMVPDGVAVREVLPDEVTVNDDVTVYEDV